MLSEIHFAFIMPLPALAIATYSAVVSALPGALPVLGTAAVALGIIATHTPAAPDAMRLAGTPEVAAECMKRNVASLNTSMVARVQPLHGTATMGVVVKRGIVGDPLMNIVIREAVSGSQAEVQSLASPDHEPDVIARIIAGC